MMGIILFTLYGKGPDEYWENTEILNEKGHIEARNQEIRSFCANELKEILDLAKQKSDNMSDKQKSKIVDKVKADPEKFSESKALIKGATYRNGSSAKTSLNNLVFSTVLATRDS